MNQLAAEGAPLHVGSGIEAGGESGRLSGGDVSGGDQRKLTASTRMDPEAVVGLGQAIDLWRTAQASVMFQMITVKASDPRRTLTQIAGFAYPTEDAATYAQKLYGANPGLFPDPQPPDPLNTKLPDPTQLRIFAKEAYPYLTVPGGGANR